MTRAARDIPIRVTDLRAGVAASLVLGALVLLAGAGARAGNDDWNATVATTSGADVADRVTVPAFPRAAQITAQPKKAKAASPTPPARLPQKQRVTKEGEPIGPSYPTVDDPVSPRAPVVDATPAANGEPGVRFSAPSLMIMQHGPLPDGQWSTIVTGALGADGAPKKPVAPARQQFVEQEPETAHPAVPPVTAAPAPATTAPPPPAKQDQAAKPAPAGSHEAGGPVPAEPAKPPAPRTFAPLPPAATAPPASPAPAATTDAKGAGTGPPLPPAAAQPPAQSAQSPGAETKPGAPVAAQAAKQPAKPLESLPPNASHADQYCFNTIDTAADARFAWQAKKITEMEGELAKRVSLLEMKTEEFKAWLARRDEFSKKANEMLVGMYARMKPDAAALQLAAMDEETAAAVLMKLNTKIASAVLGEMETARAARLAAIISGAGKVPKSSAQPGAAPVPAASKSKGDGNAAATAPAAGAKS